MLMKSTIVASVFLYMRKQLYTFNAKHSYLSVTIILIICIAIKKSDNICDTQIADTLNGIYTNQLIGTTNNISDTTYVNRTIALDSEILLQNGYCSIEKKTHIMSENIN